MIMMIVTMMIVMSRLLPLLVVVVVSRCEARDLLQGVAHVSGRIAEVSVREPIKKKKKKWGKFHIGPDPPPPLTENGGNF